MFRKINHWKVIFQKIFCTLIIAPQNQKNNLLVNRELSSLSDCNNSHPFLLECQKPANKWAFSIYLHDTVLAVLVGTSTSIQPEQTKSFWTQVQQTNKGTLFTDMILILINQNRANGHRSNKIVTSNYSIQRAKAKL